MHIEFVQVSRTGAEKRGMENKKKCKVGSAFNI